MDRRSLRRTAKIDYAALNGGASDDDEGGGRVDFRMHLHALLAFDGWAKDGTQVLNPESINCRWLAKGNFKSPTIVPKGPGVLERLGLKLPPASSSNPISIERIIYDVGAETEVRTMDCAKQMPGPRWSLHQWGQYWTIRRSVSAKSKKGKISRSKKGKKMEAVDDEAESSRIKLSDAAAGGVQDKADHPRGVAVDGGSSGPVRSVATGVLTKGISNDSRRRILEVIALQLVGTPFGNAIRPPSAVHDMHTTGQICPPSWRFHEEMGQSAGLVANMAPAGAYSDFRFAPGGAAVWLHVVSGRKVLCCIPPSKTNMAVYLAWLRLENRRSYFLGALVQDAVRVEVNAGDTVLIPAGWLVSQATLDDCLALGSTFLYAGALGGQLRVAVVEEYLQAPQQESQEDYLWYVARHLQSELCRNLTSQVHEDRNLPAQALPSSIASRPLSQSPSSTMALPGHKRPHAFPPPETEPLGMPLAHVPSEAGTGNGDRLKDLSHPEHRTEPMDVSGPSAKPPDHGAKGTVADDNTAVLMPKRMKLRLPPVSHASLASATALASKLADKELQGADAWASCGEANAHPPAVTLKLGGQKKAKLPKPANEAENPAATGRPPIPAATMSNMKVKVKNFAGKDFQQPESSPAADEPKPATKLRVKLGGSLGKGLHEAAQVEPGHHHQPEEAGVEAPPEKTGATSASAALSAALSQKRTRVKISPLLMKGAEEAKSAEPTEVAIPQMDGACDDMDEQLAAERPEIPGAADIRSSGAESRGLCKETGNSAAPDAPDVEEADPVSQRGLEMQSSAPSPAKRLTTPAGRGWPEGWPEDSVQPAASQQDGPSSKAAVSGSAAISCPEISSGGCPEDLPIAAVPDDHAGFSNSNGLQEGERHVGLVDSGVAPMAGPSRRAVAAGRDSMCAGEPEGGGKLRRISSLVYDSAHEWQGEVLIPLGRSKRSTPRQSGSALAHAALLMQASLGHDAEFPRPRGRLPPPDGMASTRVPDAERAVRAVEIGVHPSPKDRGGTVPTSQAAEDPSVLVTKLEGEHRDGTTKGAGTEEGNETRSSPSMKPPAAQHNNTSQATFGTGAAASGPHSPPTSTADDSVRISSAAGGVLGPWAAADAVALLELLAKHLSRGDGSCHVPEGISDPKELLLQLESSLGQAGLDLTSLRAEAPCHWDLEAAASSVDLDLENADVPSSLPGWAIYNDKEAMEHAADSTPEAIVGSPKEVVNSTFLPGVGLRRGNSTTWRGLSRLRMSDDVLNTHASSEHAALGPASSALRKSQQQQPRKQKKQSVQDRLRKKLRIK